MKTIFPFGTMKMSCYPVIKWLIVTSSFLIGKSTWDTERTIPEAELLKNQSDATIYVVGVTESVSVDEIKMMSSGSQKENESYWLVKDFQGLESYHMTADIIKTMCNKSEEIQYQGIDCNSSP